MTDGPEDPGNAGEEIRDPLKDLVLRTRDNVGTPFQPDVVAALFELKTKDPAKFETLRKELKLVGCRLTELDKHIAALNAATMKRDGDDDMTQVERLLKIANDAVLFHTPAGDGFADVLVNGHRETWKVRSRGFRLWLIHQYHKQVDGAPNAEAMGAAILTVEARARFDGSECPLYVRVGGIDGRIYIDLGDASWQAVEIDEHGWRVIPEPPVRFHRSTGIRPLPVPVHGGKLDELRPFLNLKKKDEDDSQFVLLVAWLLAALSLDGPYPVLGIAGEQGTAKSTLSAILRRLIDPNAAPLRALPREDRDLFIAATNAYLLVFDNVSGLLFWISDTLCRIASRGGFAVRSLYTDGDEVLFNEARPIVLNGIEDIITRPDLADRSLFVTLEKIEKKSRRAEKQLWAVFEKARPRILGALYDGVSHGLSRQSSTKLSELPRMADFALWATACETAFWKSGTFWKAYSANIAGATETVIEADIVATMVLAFLSDEKNYTSEGIWEGTPTRLLELLTDKLGKAQQQTREWPKAPHVLSGRLRRCASALRDLGVTINLGERDGDKNRTRQIKLIFTPVPEGRGNEAPEAPEAPEANVIKTLWPDAPSAAYRPNGEMKRPQDLAPKPNGIWNVMPDASLGASLGEAPDKASSPNPLNQNGLDVLDASDAEIPYSLVDALKKYGPDDLEICIDRFEERAAILEVDSGHTRAEAERRAWDEVFGNSNATE